MHERLVITGAARTPIGDFLGAFSDTPAVELGARAIKGALSRSSSLPSADIDDVFMGCVLPAGAGQAPARQAALGAGLPETTPCVTVNKVCGSGMKALIMASESLRAGSANAVVAGGMESMSLAPHLLPKSRRGIRFGGAELLDHMAYDGLTDAYPPHPAMGVFADACAGERQISRQSQDDYAERSVTLSQQAIRNGAFEDEIETVPIETRNGLKTISDDEKPGRVNPERIPQLKPAFVKDGSVTAGNASAISDGAAALVVTTITKAEAVGAAPMAEIVGWTGVAGRPADFPTAPIGAIDRLLEKVGWTISDVDLFEVNEAFAVVALATQMALKIPQEKMNIRGGAIAMGHPIGASGARIIVTLIHALRATGGRRGVASVCIGGGEATAVAVEIPG
ncbi:MAG: thiolase family protein [Pseudomonadota bacterium]